MNLLRNGARFCSGACRVAHYRAGGIPKALREAGRWVRADARKRPVRATDGRLASVTDPGTWATFKAAQASPHGVSLGFVLGAGIGCWDLDYCIVGGVLAPWAADILAAADPLFVEVSRSGAGLHVFVRSPEGPGSRTPRPGGGAIEFYSTGRFIAVTGNVWKD